MGTIKKWIFANAPNMDTYHPPEYDDYPEPTCQFFAEKFNLVVLGIKWREWNDYTTIIKNINPNCEVLNYRYVPSVGPLPTGYTPEACSWDDIKDDESYFLHHNFEPKTPENRIRNSGGIVSLVDPSSQNWRDCMINNMQNDIDDPLYGQPIDGWHLDEPKTAVWLLRGDWNISPDDPIVNPPEGAPDCTGLTEEECKNTDGCYWDGVECITMAWYDIQQADMFQELVNTFPNKIISPNVREHLYADITMAHEFEGAIHTYWWNVWHLNYSPGVCQSQINQLEDESLRGMRVRWGTGATVTQPAPSQQELEQLSKVFRSCLGGFLMGMQPNKSYFSFNYQRMRPHYGYWDEMEIDIGKPRAPYEVLAYGTGAEAGFQTLYAREFDAGTVAVNLSQSETYEAEIDGEIITLAPGEAYFPEGMPPPAEVSWLIPVAIAGAGATIGLAYLYKKGYLKNLFHKKL